MSNSATQKTHEPSCMKKHFFKEPADQGTNTIPQSYLYSFQHAGSEDVYASVNFVGDILQWFFNESLNLAITVQLKKHMSQFALKKIVFKEPVDQGTNTMPQSYLYSFQHAGSEDVHASVNFVGYILQWFFHESLNLAILRVVDHNTVLGGLVHFCHLRNKFLR